jgi:hypothetical protein
LKSRIKINVDLRDQMLFESNRICCICTEQGKDVQIHHIDENSANNDYDNLVVICLDCHSKVHQKGGFGRNWTVGQLQQYKIEWIERVENRKREADKLASLQSVTGIQNFQSQLDELNYKDINDPILSTYLEKILIIHTAQKTIAQMDFDTGYVIDTAQACDKLVDFYESILVELSTFYPKGHFQNKHPRIFFSEQIAARNIFQAYAARPEENGFIPSMHRQFISYRFMRDVRMMVRDIAKSLVEMSGMLMPDEGSTWEKSWMSD